MVQAASGLNIEVLTLIPVPGQVILNVYLPKYKIYLTNFKKIDYQ